MKSVPCLALSVLFLLAGPSLRADDTQETRIVFLHHSTGECVWNGGVPEWFAAHDRVAGTRHRIVERAFPKEHPYGWENYPYDYWNLWVRHAGTKPHRGEPTLEMLTREFDVIVFKHCFPVSAVEEDVGQPDVASPDKRLENYKLQYAALKTKLRSFPKTRFLVWTSAALGAAETDADAARRSRAFVSWVKSTWDEKGDNVFLWDFHALETEGGLYLKPAHAEGPHDSHPNAAFSRRVAPYFCQRLVDVVQGRADTTDVAGRHGRPIEAAPEPPIETEPPAEPDERAAEQPPSEPVAAGEGDWVFEGGEDASDVEQRWGAAGRAVAHGSARAVSIDFGKGERQDWGEYGPHRIVRTVAPAADRDVSVHRYVSVRVKADREVHVPLALVTRPTPRPNAFEPRFAFTAYVSVSPGDWTWHVFDLTTLELEVEGPAFHEQAGRPTRPKALTHLRLSLHEKDVATKFLIDEILFHRVLPEELRPHLRSP